MPVLYLDRLRKNAGELGPGPRTPRWLRHVCGPGGSTWLDPGGQTCSPRRSFAQTWLRRSDGSRRAASKIGYSAPEWRGARAAGRWSASGAASPNGARIAAAQPGSIARIIVVPALAASLLDKVTLRESSA